MLKQDPPQGNQYAAAAEPDLRVVIWGEQSSGKSTVINSFLRGNVVPSFFGNLIKPFALVRYDPQPRMIVHYGDGTMEEVESVEDAARVKEIAGCEIFTDQPQAMGFEIMELPFTPGGAGHPEMLALMASADIKIWTTIGSQAWRLSEKTVIEKLGPERLENAIIVVTRGDKIRNAADYERIHERVSRETAPWFRDVQFVRGSPALIEVSGHSADAWRESNGSALADLLAKYRAEIRAARQQPQASAVVLNFPDNRREEPAGPVPQVPVQVQVELPDFTLVQDDARLTHAREITESAYGIICAGILLRGGDKPQLFPLLGEIRDIAAVARFARTTLEAERRYLDVAAGEELETLTTLREHQITCAEISGGTALVFMTSLNAKMNTGIARTAFSRLAQACRLAALSGG